MAGDETLSTRTKSCIIRHVSHSRKRHKGRRQATAQTVQVIGPGSVVGPSSQSEYIASSISRTRKPHLQPTATITPPVFVPSSDCDYDMSSVMDDSEITFHHELTNEPAEPHPSMPKSRVSNSVCFVMIVSSYKSAQLLKNGYHIDKITSSNCSLQRVRVSTKNLARHALGVEVTPVSVLCVVWIA